MRIAAFATGLIVFATMALAQQRGPAPPRPVLSSSAWTDGGKLPEKYAGMGGSPPLEWTNVPDKSASLISAAPTRIGEAIRLPATSTK